VKNNTPEAQLTLPTNLNLLECRMKWIFQKDLIWRLQGDSVSLWGPFHLLYLNCPFVMRID